MGICGATSNSKGSKSNDICYVSSDLTLLDRIGSAQIQMLKKKFKKYGGKGGLDLQAFKKIMPYISTLPTKIIENAFTQFGGSDKARVSWLQFCATISQYILGTREEKCKFLYHIFDQKKTRHFTQKRR